LKTDAKSRSHTVLSGEKRALKLKRDAKSRKNSVFWGNKTENRRKILQQWYWGGHEN
jgi:hypothetical protein